jgi:DNA modification methylase
MKAQNFKKAGMDILGKIIWRSREFMSIRQLAGMPTELISIK